MRAKRGAQVWEGTARTRLVYVTILRWALMHVLEDQFYIALQHPHYNQRKSCYMNSGQRRNHHEERL